MRNPILSPVNKGFRVFGWMCFLTFGVVSCSTEPADQSGEHQAQTTAEQKLFTALDVAESGIAFQNKITETPELNYLTYNNLYSGGGLAAGDFNNDGLPDLYFTGNQVQDALYINQGELKFKDETQSAIAADLSGWHRGVCTIDINNDGWLDLYICRSGWQEAAETRTNLLLVNDGNPERVSFTEAASKYGLADAGYSTQAVFFDYDKDGDLDCYVINQPAERRPDQQAYTLEDVQALIASGKAESDRLYNNDGAGHFSDVTQQAGVFNMAYGLGVSVLDLNNDNWLDLYIANDYAAPDYAYINNGDGTFSDKINDITGHISNFGMGIDAGDINNDGLQDLMVADMAYKSMRLSKENMGAMDAEKFYAYADAGYQYQYMINTLQLNNGNGTFSEIGQLAGVAKTDWSWSPLFEDLDNDGWADIYVTNGNKRDVRNNDANINLKRLYHESGGKADFQTALDMLPVRLVSNVAFSNRAGSDSPRPLQFGNATEDWGLHLPDASHGSVIVDLDLDGDLDIVVNRENAPSNVFRNNSKNRSWIQIELEGPAANPDGLGASVTLRTGNGIQSKNMQVVRGYQSSQEAVLHFGLEGIGKNSKVKVTVQWSDGRWNTVSLAPNARHTIHHAESTDQQPPALLTASPLFEATAFSTNWHQEAPFDDFERERLLPHSYSRLGPHASAGDVNGDGLQDVFIGGALGQTSTLYLQTSNGSFQPSAKGSLPDDRALEVLGSELFDADGDGDLDLLLVPGGNEHPIKSPELKPRFYLNDGSGRFTDASDKLPPIETSGMRVATADIDGDGDLDVFLGGRITPGYYPFAPRSYLLRNDGGQFADITQEAAPDLMGPGLITDAKFGDMDRDGDPDLVIVGEWLPISIYSNNNGAFSKSSGTSSFVDMMTNKSVQTNGWWYSVELADLDGDGGLDIVAGNLGYNAKYHASQDEPLHVYCADFDQSGTYDIVLAQHQDKALLPIRGRQCTSEQMPFVAQKFPTYQAFAAADVNSIYSEQALEKALHYEAFELASCVFWNTGYNNFMMERLPIEAQRAPVNDIIASDFDGDGHIDLLLAGNNFDPEVETVRYDAGIGLLLKGTKSRNLLSTTLQGSGFFANGNVRDLELIEDANGVRILVTNNSGTPQLFTVQKRSSPDL